MNNQPECAQSILPVGEDLVDNDLLAIGGNLRRQVHIAHGHRNVAKDLNGIASLDGVVVPCVCPTLLNEPFVSRKVEIFTDKVRECALPGRPKVLRRVGQSWAEEYPALLEVVQSVDEIDGQRPIVTIVTVCLAYRHQPFAPIVLS